MKEITDLPIKIFNLSDGTLMVNGRHYRIRDIRLIDDKVSVVFDKESITPSNELFINYYDELRLEDKQDSPPIDTDLMSNGN